MKHLENKNIVDNFDFTKNYDPKDTLGQFVKKSFVVLASTAILAHKNMNYKVVRKIAITCAVIFSVGAFFNMIGTWRASSAKVDIAKMQENNKKESLELEQNIKTIKTYNQEDIDNTVVYLKKVQSTQLQRTVDFYWKFKYISDKDKDRYPVAKTSRAISDMRMKINEYYDNRVILVPHIYKTIMLGGKEFSKDDTDNVIFWHNSMKGNINRTYGDLDNYLNYWNEDFIDQKAIQGYLESNKEMIAKTNPFL